MTQYIIDIGAYPDDGQGSPLRTAFDYTNENFNQIFAAGPVLSNIRIGNNTITTTVLNSNLILSPSGIGRIQLNNTLFPRLDDVYDIGTPSLRFNSIYLGTGGIDTIGGITTTGNITAGYFIGNGSQLTGIVATTGSEVVNGTSNINIPSPGSNIFVTVNGTGNVVTFANTGMYVAGEVSATGNISGNYILGNGALLTGINIGYGNSNVAAFLPTYTGNLVSLTGPVTTTANVTGGNLRTAGSISATGNITGGNINTGRLNAGYITTGTTISALGNIATSSYFIGDGSLLTNLPAGNYSNANVAAFLPTYTGNLVSLTGPVITTSNITGSNVSAVGNITAGNIDTGRVNAGNITVSGPVSAVGNISGNYILGNGAFLTGINANYGNANVAAFLPTYTGNLVSLTGPVTTTANVTGGNLRTTGQISASGNITGGNVDAGRVNAGNVTVSGLVSATGNITTSAYFIGDGSQLTNLPAGNYSNANVAAFLPTYTGNLVSLTGPVTTTANITSGNLRTTGQISATGNITGNNIDGNRVNANIVTVNSTISAAGNITGNNLIGATVTATTVTAIANVVGGNITTVGQISSTGNIQGGNLNVPGGTVTSYIVSAIGQIQGGNFVTPGSITATGNITGGNVDTGNVHAGNINVDSIISAIGNIYGNNFIGRSLSVTGNVSAGNVAITGTFGAASLSASGNITGGNLLSVGIISTSGNVAGSYFVGNGSQLTGITVSAGTSILNGNSNVVVAANGAVTISSAGVSNVASFANTGAYILGEVSATGNITGTYLLGNGAFITGLPAGYSNADVANYLPTYTGNLVSLTGPVITTANITGGNVLTSAEVIANGVIQTGTGFSTGGYLSVNGNTDLANTNVTGYLSATGNIAGNYFIGNGSLLTGVTASGVNASALTGNTLSSNVLYSSLTQVGNLANLSVTGSATVGNVLTGGIVSATGNVTGNYILGNGAFLSGVITSVANINNGTSNITVVSSGGNITVGVGGTANVVVFATTGEYITGLLSASGNITGSNILTGGLISSTGNIVGGNVTTAGQISATGNIVGNYFIGNGSQLTGVAASSVNANALVGNTLSSNVLYSSLTQVGNLANLSVVGNTVSGNLLTSGLISATGNVTSSANITGGNLKTGGSISATGNATVGNLLTGGLVSATGNITSTANITGGNVLTAGLISATGNATAGNILTGGLISATGNITGGNVSIVGGTLAFANANIIQDNPLDLAITGSYQISVKPGGGSYQWTFGNDGSLTGPTGVGTTGYLSAAGNVTGNNVFATGFASVTGNVIAGNVNTSNIRPTTGELTITTASGNLNLQPAGNIVLANTFINSVAYPEQDTDAASKLYVDNIASTGITYHTPAYAATTTTLAVATGGTITYAQPNGVSNGVGAYLSTTGSFNLIDSANVQTVGTRILVKNEGNAVYNGVYTWSNATVIVRSTDTNTYGSQPNTLSLNDYFFTTNGNVNAGSAFVVNAPVGVITFGTSNITFALFSQATTYTANVDAGLSLIGTQFNAKVDQNTTAFDNTGNIIVKAGANLTTPNIGAATGTSLSLTGNINSGNVNTGGLLSATGNVTGGNVLTAGLISATGTATLGNVLTSGLVSSTGNITSGNLLTSGLISATSTITSSANITGGNLLTSGLISATGNITGGNLSTSGILTVTGNIISLANISGGNVLTGGQVSATGNITGGNVLTAGVVSATGNISGNYFLGNGSQLTGVIAAGGLGNTIQLGTPTDGNLAGNTVAYTGWTTSTYVTDAVDDLNQVAFNIAANTYVGNAYITANTNGNINGQYAGPSPLTIQFTGHWTGNSNSYLWQFGDGSGNAATANATHTFSNSLGGTYTTSYTVYNSNGTYGGNAAAGAKGSVSTVTASILLYTPSPSPGFTLSANSFNTGTQITISNNSTYVTWYDLSFGDGTGNFVAGPGYANTTFTSVTHTYNASAANTDSLYSVILSGTSNTAGASNVTVTTTANAAGNVKVYSSQASNVFVTANRANVINGLGGISFRNDSTGTPGNTASFGSQQYYYLNYGDGNVSNVNIGTGIAGNPSAANVVNTFALSAANQAANAYQQFTANLSLYTGYSTSPAKSGNITITVEPQTRANYIGTTANVITDATANTGNARVGYLYTDYNNSNRSTFTFQNTSQNSNLANWSWGDSTFSNGVSNVGNALHTYNSTGAFTVALTANGTPNGITSTAQSNTLTTTGYIFIASNPTAPTNLSGFSNLAIANASQFTNAPLLAAGAADATGGNIVANGTSVTRFATTTPIATSGTIVNANTGISSSQLSANLFAYVNNANAGNVTFSNVSALSGTTVGALVITQDQDLHVANAAVPSYFYKVFSANVSCALSSLSTGYNNYKLVDSVTGNTNYVGFVKDNLNVAPTLTTSGAGLTSNVAGTYNYISGIPYYGGGGSPAVTLSNVQVVSLTGQTYTATSPFTVASGTNQEGSGSVISAQTYTLTQINGSPSMLTGSIANANVGVGSTYTLGNTTVLINGAVNAVANLKANILNVIGTSSDTQIPTYIQVNGAANTGVQEANIAIAPTGGFTNPGIRVTGFGSASNTPAFSQTTNFYTANAWSGNITVAGTQEAVIRYGNLKNYTTNLSTNYLPVGPDLATGRSGTQYFTFAFQRTLLQNFSISLVGNVSGVWATIPGTKLAATVSGSGPTSTLNGWLTCSVFYTGSGTPGANTAAGGNGSNGIATNAQNQIPVNTAISSSYNQTFGDVSSSTSGNQGNNILIRIALSAGQYLTSLSIGN